MGENIVKGGSVCYNGAEAAAQTHGDLPAWAIKLARRVAGLARPGRYMIIVSLRAEERPNWTVTCLGSVERPDDDD